MGKFSRKTRAPKAENFEAGEEERRGMAIGAYNRAQRRGKSFDQLKIWRKIRGAIAGKASELKKIADWSVCGTREARYPSISGALQG